MKYYYDDWDLQVSYLEGKTDASYGVYAVIKHIDKYGRVTGSHIMDGLVIRPMYPTVPKTMLKKIESLRNKYKYNGVYYQRALKKLLKGE